MARAHTCAACMLHVQHSANQIQVCSGTFSQQFATCSIFLQRESAKSRVLWRNGYRAALRRQRFQVRVLAGRVGAPRGSGYELGMQVLGCVAVSSAWALLNNGNFFMTLQRIGWLRIFKEVTGRGY